MLVVFFFSLKGILYLGGQLRRRSQTPCHLEDKFHEHSSHYQSVGECVLW